MVKLGLFIKAELDGVTNLSPVDTPTDPYFYTFKVICGSCREVNDNWISISRQVHLPKSEGLLIITLGEDEYQWKPSRGKLCLEMQKL
jgi:hypothetical protein